MAARTIDDSYRPFSLRFSRHVRSILGGASLAATVALASGCQIDQEYVVSLDQQGADSCDDVDPQEAVRSMVGLSDYRCEGAEYYRLDSVEVVAEDTEFGECTVRATWVHDPTFSEICAPLPPGTAVDGRPLVVAEQARVAGLRRGGSWSAAVPATGVELSAEQRRILAARWLRAGLYEHASIASFARFTLDLMVHGAPPELLLAAQRAAADEIRHARMCFGLAAAYGEPVEPAKLELGAALPMSADLVQLAVDTAKEGCIGETLAAIRAAEQLARATDPAVRSVLATLVEDEGEHAELAWRTLRWAVDLGGEPVRVALRGVFADVQVHGFTEDAPSDPALEAHGLLADADVRRALQRAIDRVILPAAGALLA